LSKALQVRERACRECVTGMGDMRRPGTGRRRARVDVGIGIGIDIGGGGGEHGRRDEVSNDRRGRRRAERVLLSGAPSRYDVYARCAVVVVSGGVDEASLLDAAREPDEFLLGRDEPAALEHLGGNHADVVDAPKEFPPREAAPAAVGEGVVQLVAELGVGALGPEG